MVLQQALHHLGQLRLERTGGRVAGLERGLVVGRPLRLRGRGLLGDDGLRYRGLDGLDGRRILGRGCRRLGVAGGAQPGEQCVDARRGVAGAGVGDGCGLGLRGDGFLDDSLGRGRQVGGLGLRLLGDDGDVGRSLSLHDRVDGRVVRHIRHGLDDRDRDRDRGLGLELGRRHRHDRLDGAALAGICGLAGGSVVDHRRSRRLDGCSWRRAGPGRTSRGQAPRTHRPEHGD